MYRECVWRIEGQFRLHIEPLIPSYVFVETEAPDAFFIVLEKVSEIAVLLEDGEAFYAVGKEEKFFLSNMMETAVNFEEKNRPVNKRAKNYLIKCSLVCVDSEGQIVSAEGALEKYVGHILKQRLRKCSVIVEIPFLGELRKIQLGIRLEEDEFLKM